MSYAQIPFAGIEFADNPEPRCPCILLLDTSASMKGEPIRELNNGLLAFKDELIADSMASKRTEIAVISFGPPKIEVDFTSGGAFEPPVLDAMADTPMGAAIALALGLLDQRKATYKQ